MSSDHDDVVAREQQAQIEGGLTADGAMEVVRRRTASPEKKRAMVGAYADPTFPDEVMETIREGNADSRLSAEDLANPALSLEHQGGNGLPDARAHWLGE